MAGGATARTEKLPVLNETERSRWPAKPAIGPWYSGMKEKLLIVENDEASQTQMRWSLDALYNFAIAADRAAALRIFREARPPVVILDLGFPPSPASIDEGFATLSELLAVEPLTKIVIIADEGQEDVAHQAIGLGAFDCFIRPLRPEPLKVVLNRCFYVARLEREHRELKQRFYHDSFEGLLGTAPAMRAVYDTIRKVAATDAPVLISGESGTGKETTALAIHHRSSRRSNPFVACNCGAIPAALFEEELFGDERGATSAGAVTRKGRIEKSAGGTLFLAEIGAIPVSVQVKLLRFLQHRTFERIGGRQTLTVDSRIIAATHVDLKAMVQDGSFRDDLYYGLAVVEITLPPLRDRNDDVVLLARAFLRDLSQLQQKQDLTFGPDALQAIRRHNWPGNLRELQNRVRRAAIMADGNSISAADLELAPDRASQATEMGSLREARERLEREMIQHALRKHAGNISAAAAELEISRPTLYQMLNKFGLEKVPGNENEVL